MSASPSPSRCQVSTATVISAADSRKWKDTTYGLSLVSTVSPPHTALNTTTQNCAQASRYTPRRGGSRLARTAMITQPTVAHST